MVKLKHGDLYKNKHYQRVLELRQDYDGLRWYMYRRTKKGVTKTLSISTDEMINEIEQNYEKVEK